MGRAGGRGVDGGGHAGRGRELDGGGATGDEAKPARERVELLVPRADAETAAIPAAGGAARPLMPTLWKCRRASAG